jgi:hypothetical protein
MLIRSVVDMANAFVGIHQVVLRSLGIKKDTVLWVSFVLQVHKLDLKTQRLY